MDTIYILDVKNCQENYAEALAFIKVLEDKQIDIKKSTEILMQLALKISVSVGNTRKNLSPRYLEQPIWESGQENEGIQNRHRFGLGDITALLAADSNAKYLLRVHFEKRDQYGMLEEAGLIHLQHLALFLKRLSELFSQDALLSKERDDIERTKRELKRRLTVFLVPITGEVFPFCDMNGQVDGTTYLLASRYLRLLSKTYTGVIYGVSLKKEPVVTSLDFRTDKRGKAYFPLVIVDEDMYDVLFTDSIKDTLDELFSLRQRGRFRDSRNEDPRKALVDFIAETDLSHIRDTVSPEREQEILQFLKTRREISLFEFSLFAFLLSAQTMMRQYIKVWNFAHEISQGVRHIVQNAIQHTDGKECFLSFYLHVKSSEGGKIFVDKIIEKYPDTCFDMSSGEAALEVLISDLNEKEDMVDNFIGNLKYESKIQKKHGGQDLAGHSRLIECGERLAVRNFFSIYHEEDAKEEWKSFRQEDLVAHIGLSQFALTAEKCKASIKVISSKDCELSDERKICYKAYSGENRHGVRILKWKNAYVIPGTQFSILVPVQNWGDSDSMGMGQLTQLNAVREDYASFASFLDYHEKRLTIAVKKDKVSDLYEKDILDARRKFRLVQSWRAYWEKKFGENVKETRVRTENGENINYVFNYDFDEVSLDSYFQNADRIEVCLKGMISALDVAANLKEGFCVAFTNLPEGFLEVFQNISVQIGVRKFPGGVQMFLQAKQENGEKRRRTVMMGNDFSQAINNAYILSMEQGEMGFDISDCRKAMELKAILMPETERQEAMQVAVCPFDVIIRCSTEDERTMFEKHLKEMAEESMDEGGIGYKLNDTHIRLGNRIHIESFYEMAVLFYRTTVANRLAFHILRHMRETLEEEKEIDMLHDAILFYGYASYSKAVLTSISEILRAYRVKNSNGDEGLEDKVAFAAFQHNLMTESEKTQMYYDLPSENFPGKVGTGHCLHLDGEVKAVQIVPISSTLTTFDKMWKAFLDSMSRESQEKICLTRNYTVFWVVDQGGCLERGLPSMIEERYWEETDALHKIKTKLSVLEGSGDPFVRYFVRSAAIWHDPLRCELCYPQYVINEVPLVETDLTSTVPTQQIRQNSSRIGRQNEVSDEEYDRFVKLRNCTSYDHIWRRQNHYQFFIDTQQYFYCVKDMVRRWLVEEKVEIDDEPVMHIIFSPEHNTNAGFVQYVNTYCFNGLAEIISINVDKHFRSNFICEYAGLKKKIEELHRDRTDASFLPVKFYFVDDAIVTGDTFQRANGLLHSLVPVGEYPVKLFSKVFVLVDRLSEDTKQIYVDKPKQNFKAFLHVDISNIRTHGDSCIGCKLEQNANKLYKRSATKNMARHWAGKICDYKRKAYDDREKMGDINKEKSYQMLLFSHVLQNMIVKQGNYHQMGNTYDILLELMLWLLEVDRHASSDIYGYGKLLRDMRNMTGVHRLLKTVCRPFFSYDFRIKKQVYAFFIFLTELLLGERIGNIVPEVMPIHSQYLQDHGRMSRMKLVAENIRRKMSEEKESELEFLKVYMLEGLTDMGSTYPMRMQTIKKCYNYVEGEENKFSEEAKCSFWDSYSVNIYRLISENADESRELWLEYMYMTGMEYREFKNYRESGNTYVPKFLYEAITGKKLSEPQPKYFYLFCHNLFFQNTGIHFDGLEEKYNNLQVEKPMSEDFLRDCWGQMRCLASFKNPLANSGGEVLPTESEKKLFELLQGRDAEENGHSVHQWYEKFLEHIIGVIGEKYRIDKRAINAALLAKSNEELEGDEVAEKECMQKLDIVRENIHFEELSIPETRYHMKDRIIKALNKKDLFELEKFGYTISGEQEGSPYVIAFFDDSQKTTTSKHVHRIVKVFLYIGLSQDSCSEEESGTKESTAVYDKRMWPLILRLILRDVMMYRNSIWRSLEQDFAGEIYASYAHTIGEKNILSHEKANSHASTDDDEISLEIFREAERFADERAEGGDIYEAISKEQAATWLVLRNYTNGQIAKIFNRSFHDGRENPSALKVPKLYVSQEGSSENKRFRQKLDVFLKLDLRNERSKDGRLKLLNEIIDIQYEDSLNEATFICGKKGECYNLEYFKCILIDIMLSAIKFESDRPDFLTRIDRFYSIKKELEEVASAWKHPNAKSKDEEEIASWIARLENSRCHIKIFRKQSPISGIDYLVLRNPVKNLSIRSKDWEKENMHIAHRLEDPLDYSDGHMSLLAINRYIKNLDMERSLECAFQYSFDPAEGVEGELYFENRLPVLNGTRKE